MLTVRDAGPCAGTAACSCADVGGLRVFAGFEKPSAIQQRAIMPILKVTSGHETAPAFPCACRKRREWMPIACRAAFPRSLR